MVDEKQDLSPEALRIATDAEPAQDGEEIEIEPFADEPVLLEEKDSAHPIGNGSARRWKSSPRAPMGSYEIELNNYCALRMMQGMDHETKVRKGRVRLEKKGRDFFGSLVPVPRRNDLISRVVERPHGLFKRVATFGINVGTDEGGAEEK